MFGLDFVLNSTNGKLISGRKPGEFAGVSTDSRNVSAGEIFFALKGDNYDGHRFVDEALRKGAAGAV
ncbi:MAG: Mur ligase domain-containing protein, partial [Thermodesulfobacteriota bacterium]